MTTTNPRFIFYALSVAAFLAGISPVYFKARGSGMAWSIDLGLDLIMAGLLSLGPFIAGYWTKNPALQPTTSAALLESVKASDIPIAVKAQVAPALAQESAKPGAMGLPLTEQQVAAKQLYQAQKPDLEALEVQRLARARLAPPTQEKAEHDVDALLANIETARAALAARRAQLEAQERRLTTGLAPPTTTTTERAPGEPIQRGSITP